MAIIDYIKRKRYAIKNFGLIGSSTNNIFLIFETRIIAYQIPKAVRIKSIEIMIERIILAGRTMR